MFNINSCIYIYIVLSRYEVALKASPTVLPSFAIQMQQRINRPELTDSAPPPSRRMKKTLSGSTPQLVHHGVAALRFSEAELKRRAIVAKYLSPPPPQSLVANDKTNVILIEFGGGRHT